jgi:hypothetical protein
MTFSLNEGEKFACIAFAHVGLEPELIEQVPLDLGDDVWVLDRPHFDFPAYWRGWIGSIKADRVSDSNLFLLKKKESKTPEVLDHENQELIKEVERIFYGIVIQGMPQYEAAYRLTGSFSKDKAGLRQFTEVYDHHAYARKTPVSPRTCRIAKAVASGIREMLSLTAFLRLQRGFKALIDATRVRYLEDAVHQFVRAMDALIIPRVGSSKRDFAHRCQIFSIANEANRKVLEEIYDIRSNVEHMHEWNGVATTEEAMRDEPILKQRLYQIESLALAVYLKIMTSSTHRNIFHSNSTIHEFWALPDDEKLRVWADSIDLTSIKAI